jgi:hypothetical protein
MRLHRAALAVLALLSACAPAAEVSDEQPYEENPFLRFENEPAKEDTAYVNPAGREIEVDLEGDISESISWRREQGPAALGSFAQTYLRKRKDFYLESLAEAASSKDRVEWLIGTKWKSARNITAADETKLKHFRIRGVNAVVLNDMAKRVTAGATYEAKVPLQPFGLLAAFGDKCADPDNHMTLTDTVYWYLWNPDRGGCTVPTQQLKVKVAQILPKGQTVYPEYDKLLADKKVTSVILFGQIGDTLDDKDAGMVAFNRVANWLQGAGYKEIKPAPAGRRFSRSFSGVEFVVDIYSPRDFSGLGDFANLPNLQRAIGEHEVVAYDGHSMLGASDFWARPTYPSHYQIMLYGGCLGYEYYVKPILDAKGGWANLDMMSSVIEVTASSQAFAVPVIAKLAAAVSRGNNVSWQQILSSVRQMVGDETFGVSGVRCNRYFPPGVKGTPATDCE